MKLIKKALFVILVLVVSSCSVDEGDSYVHEILPVESIDLPHEFVLNETYFIDFTFRLPTSCHDFYDILVTTDNENRTVGVMSAVYDRSNCQEMGEENLYTSTFRFDVIYDQNYVFHIWKGKDNLGEDIYETIIVPIVN